MTIRLKLQPQPRLRPQLQPLMTRQTALNPVPVHQVIVVAVIHRAVIPQVRRIVAVIHRAVIPQVQVRGHLGND